MKYIQTFNSMEEYEAVKDTLPENCVFIIEGQNTPFFHYTPSTFVLNLKTINGQSILGEGDITIGTDADSKEIIDALYSKGFNEDFCNDFAI